MEEKNNVGNKDFRQKEVVIDTWRKKLRNREEMLKYLKTAERYWFSDEWYGSEKMKTPA